MIRTTRRWFVACAASLVASLIIAPSIVRAEDNATFKRTEDVIYARKFGTALTLDVFRPGKANGMGIIYIVSSGMDLQLR